MGERQDRTLKVRGSNPLPSTKNINDLDDSFPKNIFRLVRFSVRSFPNVPLRNFVDRPVEMIP